MPNVDQDGLSAHLPSLRIAIVGAGIGGLATSIALARAGFKDVVIYEQTKEIAEVGAGIQVAPNFARLLRRWGCLDRLQKDAIALEANSLRRYADDTELGASPFMPGVEQKWGAPLWVVHRADVQRVLLEYAQEIGVDVKTGRHVDDVDFGVESMEAEAPIVGTPRVCLKNRGEKEGKWEEADVILAADGIRSSTRVAMMKRHGLQDHGKLEVPTLCVVLLITCSSAEDTGDAAYRMSDFSSSTLGAG
jgi:salicylate hydroxylase